MKKLVILLVSCFAFFLAVDKIYGDDCAAKGNLAERIACYESELSKVTSQAKTLSSQIAQFDSQIKLTTLKISQTQDKIVLLGGRIDQLEVSLDSLTKAFSGRAVETYKLSRFENNIFFVFSAVDITDAAARFHYLQKIQEEDRSLLIKLQEAQTLYIGEKASQEDLQKELEDQKKALNNQKLAKKTLLDQTKNDEKKYQTLLSQALAEKAAIERALISGVKVGPVNQGDPIALVGNSGYPGCSSGKHLHFEVRKNNAWVDPAPYLQNKTVQDEQSGGSVAIGSGNWQWPIADTVRLTQHYGHTPYSWKYSYSGGIHTGLDMVSTSSDVIKAPANGELFKSSQSCGGSSIINIVYIDHGDNLISLYLHVQ